MWGPCGSRSRLRLVVRVSTGLRSVAILLVGSYLSASARRCAVARRRRREGEFRVCVVCGRTYYCYSDQRVTCSDICYYAHLEVLLVRAERESGVVLPLPGFDVACLDCGLARDGEGVTCPRCGGFRYSVVSD